MVTCRTEGSIPPAMSPAIAAATHQAVKARLRTCAQHRLANGVLLIPDENGKYQQAAVAFFAGGFLSTCQGVLQVQSALVIRCQSKGA